jgi:methyl-accepting chemotaxis protein
VTIVRRMSAGYTGLLFLLLVVAGVGVGGILWLDSRFNDYSETTRAQVIGAAAIRESSLPMSYIAKAAVLATTEARRTKYLKDLDTAWTSTLEAISAVAALAVKAGEIDDAASLEELKTSLNEYHTALLATIGSTVTDSEQAITEVESRLVPMGQAFDGLAHEYEDAQVRDEAAQIASLSSSGNVMVFVMAAVVALAIVAGILLQVYTSRDIGRRLRAAVASLSSSSAEILAIASQVSAGASQTAASTNEATVTVEEVRQTAVLAHEKASEAAEGAQAAVGMAGSARTLVDETISGIEHMQSEMDVVFETINRLSEQTQAAGDIISSVNDLAEQSNLLSVNASIEAAKAGDHGKGFAVVAQEVKTLAEQSKQAVAQVRTILTEIQKASQKAVQAAAHGRESVEAGRQQSLEAGEVIQRVSDGAARDAQSSVQVTASSQQQLAGMEQIAQAIASISAAGQQSVAGTRQVEREVAQLQELAVSLRSLIEAKPKDKTEAE